MNVLQTNAYTSRLMLTPQVGNTIAEDYFACHFQKREKIPKPLFSPVIILLKETTTTPKPYSCGQDVVGLLFFTGHPSAYRNWSGSRSDYREYQEVPGSWKESLEDGS